MSILIKGMEMPKEGFIEVLIRDDGTAQQTGQSYRIDGTDYYTPYVGEMPDMYEAVSVPPHGRLNDWCGKVVDSPDIDRERICKYYRTASNADKIRAMTDEELAECFGVLKDCQDCICRNEDDSCNITDGSCQKQWLNWLRKEAEDGISI